MIAIEPLAEHDLPAAEHIMRLAFGTFLGLPEPLAYMGDAAYVRTRWRADPTAAFGAKVDGELVGSNFATHWGSVGFFGPLTVHPRFWDQGVGSRLLEPILARFAAWGTIHAGLFTFAHSPKHLALYQKFGFWPRYLTAILSKPVEANANQLAPRWSRLADISASERDPTLAACRQVTAAIYAGLDVEVDIRAVEAQGLGDTVLLHDESGGEDRGRLAGFAVCHCGPGSEAGSGTCYVKFGAVRPGLGAGETFDRLIDACVALAAVRGLSRLVAGVNTARHEAYRRLLTQGFRADRQGVAMDRPNEPGYNRPGVYLIDDWR